MEEFLIQLGPQISMLLQKVMVVRAVGLLIVLINANACFLVLVASTWRNAWCVFTDILMVTMSENPLLHCFYFISSVMSSIVFCKTTLVEFPQSICRCKDVLHLVCLDDTCGHYIMHPLCTDQKSRTMHGIHFSVLYQVYNISTCKVLLFQFYPHYIFTTRANHAIINA